jgi:hypothetical protein
MVQESGATHRHSGVESTHRYCGLIRDVEKEIDMSGKPPSGKGNRRWNLGQTANKSNEKKDILRAIDDIYNILDGAQQQNEQSKERNFSEILFRLSRISIPSKQTNLTKVNIVKYPAKREI